MGCQFLLWLVSPSPCSRFADASLSLLVPLLAVYKVLDFSFVYETLFQILTSVEEGGWLVGTILFSLNDGVENTNWKVSYGVGGGHSS